MDNQCYGSLFLVDESSFLSGRADLIVSFAKLIRVPYKLDCFTLSSISAIFRTRTWYFKNIQKLQKHEGRHRITGTTTLDTARVWKKQLSQQLQCPVSFSRVHIYSLPGDAFSSFLGLNTDNLDSFNVDRVFKMATIT